MSLDYVQQQGIHKEWPIGKQQGEGRSVEKDRETPEKMKSENR